MTDIRVQANHGVKHVPVPVVSIGEDEDNPRYYLHDCYPAQFINDERTKANIKKNAMQWETFTKYLESKSKLKK